ncbi:hypothetical protein AVEN_188326-1 [Araneus ventricosus]|uniref:HTH psq-type domain-containing protein n=1 Tax=Araneus ventricosus TaxID=182803 RepID=A0A4Y2UE91_ARAVE|nr:hypothetical protein AVEN_90118-1 [Araneus ventricosus]GBO09854.1 hypothetical protein AVEN_188326-1 [Araneus ventricosus]
MPKRKCLSIKEKNLILHEVDKGVKKKGYCFKIWYSSKQLINHNKKNRDKIQNYDSSNFCSKRLKACVYEDVDEVVLKWTVKNKNSTAMNCDEDEDDEDGNDHDAEINKSSYDEMLKFINFHIK